MNHCVMRHSRLTCLVESGLWQERDNGLTLSFLQPCFNSDCPCATNELVCYAILLCLDSSNLL